MGKDSGGTPDPDVFVIGDAATIEGSPLPATAQVANQQAKYVARRLNGLVRRRFLPESFFGSSSASKTRPPPSTPIKPESEKGDALTAPAPEKLSFASEHEHEHGPEGEGEAYEGAPFVFKNAGSLAYVGGWEAVFDRTKAASGPRGEATGRLAGLLWRSAYFTRTLSVRNKILVPAYW